MNQESTYSSHVRFTREEYLRIKRDSLETGKSIPWLLKTAYLRGSIASPTLDVESRKSVLRTLAYMGNNLNQLVKNVNSGLISNVKEEVSEILGTCRMLRSFLGLDYGNRKDSV